MLLPPTIHEPFAKAKGQYVLTVVPDADGRGGAVRLSGPGTLVYEVPEKSRTGVPAGTPLVQAWAIHVGFVPRSARVSHLGQVVLLGGESHALVLVDQQGKPARDYSLNSLFAGESLRLARSRLRRGYEPFEADFASAAGTAEDYRIDGFPGVRLRRLPIHEGFTIWQGTVFVVGENPFYVRVGMRDYAWFDPANGELLSRDAPNGPSPFPNAPLAKP